MVFDSPQWKLTEAPEPTDFAYAKSELTVTNYKGRQQVRNINVPTAFFGMANALFSSQTMQQAREHGVVFFLEQEQDAQGNWLFGFEIPGIGFYLHLWYYTPKTVPGWLT